MRMFAGVVLGIFVGVLLGMLLELYFGGSRWVRRISVLLFCCWGRVGVCAGVGR